MDGLTAASSGLLADERLQQVVMNNISNLSTPGFKQSAGELMAFPEQLLQRYGYDQGLPGNALGAVNNGSLFQESVSNFTQGLIKSTGQPFDLALSDPPVLGTSVYTETGGQATLQSTLSFVVGKGGLIETAQGAPIIPVDAAGNPIPNARVHVNPQFKGLDLFGEDGSPVVDAAGHPSYQVVDAKGQPLAGAVVRMTSAQTGGVHSFFPIENVDAQGRTRVALTRDGHFQVGADQYLYSATGQRVLAVGANGQPILNSAIRINPAYQGTAYFGPGGQPLRDGAGNLSYVAVRQGGQPIAGAALGPIAVDVGTLQPLGSAEFVLTPQSQVLRSQASVQAGALESSNADDTQNMVDMLAIYRSYEANQKMAQTIDTELQQTVTVGTVQGL